MSQAADAPRRPPVVTALAVLIALAILLGLGTWQLERRAWKGEILDRIATRSTQPPVPLPTQIENPADWDYAAVQVSGQFRYEATVFLGPRTWKGQPGAHAVTPLLRAEGPPVLVNRGWIPDDQWDLASRPDPGGAPAPVTVTGIARVPQPQGWLQLENRPAERFFFWADPGAMAAAMGLETVAPVIVEVGPTPAGTLPVGGQTVVDIPNNHLQYAITWFSFAAILLVIVGLGLARRRR